MAAATAPGVLPRARDVAPDAHDPETRAWLARFAQLDLAPTAVTALLLARRYSVVAVEQLRTHLGVDVCAARAILASLVAAGLLRPVGRGRSTKFVLDPFARRSTSFIGTEERLRLVVAHARATGSVSNRDVRELLDVDGPTARAALNRAVAAGVLVPLGERRTRRYAPVQREWRS